MKLLVRNVVKDFDSWKTVFDAESERAADAGLKLLNLWRDLENPNEVFFLMSVENQDRALDFMSHPTSMDAGERSGVEDGEAHFIEEVR